MTIAEASGTGGQTGASPQLRWPSSAQPPELLPVLHQLLLLVILQLFPTFYASEYQLPHQQAGVVTSILQVVVKNN